jgi:hypothetical protein
VTAEGDRMDGNCAVGMVMPTLSPRSVSATVAVTVFICGFGALNVASAVMSFSPKLPGLYSYRSATLGDGFLLPLLAYGLIRAIAIQEPWSRRARLVVACAALVGGAAGVATQAVWLTSATTPRNWTIPAPHSYNFAGWYHAAFLSIASAFFAASTAGLWLRVHSEPAGPALSRLRLPGSFAITIPPLAFAGLLALDNVPVGQDPLHASTFILPVATLFILYLLMLTATHWRDVKTPTMLSAASAIPAACLTMIFWPSSIFRAYSLLIALALFGGVVISSPSRRSRVVGRATAASLISISLAGPIIMVADASNVALRPFALALASGIVLAAGEQFFLQQLARRPVP